jgi:hypothetical protein
VRSSNDEEAFTDMLRHIYRRHANVVPVMAKVGRDLMWRSCATLAPATDRGLVPSALINVYYVDSETIPAAA